jgi:hypothetical protein
MNDLARCLRLLGFGDNKNLGRHDDRLDKSAKLKFAVGRCKNETTFVQSADRPIAQSVDKAERVSGPCIKFDVSMRAICMSRTARPLRLQHQLPAERNDPAAHAGTARLIFAAAYGHAFAKITAGFEGVSRGCGHENRGHKSKKTDTTHAKRSRVSARFLIALCVALRVMRPQE